MGQTDLSITTSMKRILAFGTLALAMAACSPDKKIDPSVTSAKPVIEEVFTSSETLNGTPLTYPAGKPELRLYKVEIPAGGKIPLHKSRKVPFMDNTASTYYCRSHVQPSFLGDRRPYWFFYYWSFLN